MEKKEEEKEEKNISGKISNNEKKEGKRKRINNKKKAEKDILFKCEYCEKLYTKNSSLKFHLKTKHNFELNGDESAKLGRPTIDSKSKEKALFAFNEYITFFEVVQNQNRNPYLLDRAKNGDKISLDEIKLFIKETFELYKNFLFSYYESEENYPLYQLVKDNWEEKTPKIHFESYVDDTNNKKKSDNSKIKKSNSPCVDELFYLYVKEYSEKTNKKYFKFMIKFVFLFREYINKFKKEIVTKDIIIKDKKEYTQLFNGKEISELSNDFLIDFIDSNKFSELNREEITELLQHFCYWLYDNHYSESHLIKLNN